MKNREWCLFLQDFDKNKTLKSNCQKLMYKNAIKRNVNSIYHNPLFLFSWPYAQHSPKPAWPFIFWNGLKFKSVLQHITYWTSPRFSIDIFIHLGMTCFCMENRGDVQRMMCCKTDLENQANPEDERPSWFWRMFGYE